MLPALETDALVIGSGIAGLSAAVELAQKGVSVTVLSAGAEMSDCNTNWAQGGIIYQARHPDPEKLTEDIMEAGCGINYRPAVAQLVGMGPKLVEELLIRKIQVPLDHLENGELSLTREGGHSENRIVHKGDESGRSIEEAMFEYAKTFSQIKFLPRSTVVNLLMTAFHGVDRSKTYEPARCFGAFVFDQANAQVYPIFSQHTVLATGGVGQLYLYNTNTKWARGDGIALASRAGCRLANLEYVQFHPTTFYHAASRRFLISEALRGEGAVLINSKGERFLPHYLPQYSTPELAPRDRVAKAIHEEMLATGASHVFLDISHLSSEKIQSRFPWVYRNCLKFDVDITKEPIPVVPGAHYLCGGVWVDLEGKTTVPHLWAVGEVSCTGLHGANRLASTSLLEGLVWGTRAAEGIVRELRDFGREKPVEIEPWVGQTGKVDPAFLKQDWMTLQQTMWNYVGLIKSGPRLRRADGILSELARGIDVFYRKASLSDELIGLRHSVLVARMILNACERNTKTLGCYLREDLEI